METISSNEPFWFRFLNQFVKDNNLNLKLEVDKGLYSLTISQGNTILAGVKTVNELNEIAKSVVKQLMEKGIKL